MLAAMVRLAKQHSSIRSLMPYVNRFTSNSITTRNKSYVMARNCGKYRFQRLSSLSPCSKSSSKTSHTSPSFSAFTERSTTGGVMDELFEDNKPFKLRFGLLKVITTIMFGVYFGAFIAKLGANLLEEYEIFVHGEDDDD